MRHQEPSPSGEAAPGCIAYAPASHVSSAAVRQPELCVEERAVIIHKQSRDGTVMRVAVPFEHYRGISADISYNADGLNCSIVMAHDNRELEMTLFSASDDENILAEWNAWSQKLLLPMMIRTEHGDVTARQQFGSLQVGSVAPRRARSAFLMRRPRFLRRREVGSPEHLEIYNEREIIART